jgi:hypothetical protein
MWLLCIVSRYVYIYMFYRHCLTYRNSGKHERGSGEITLLVASGGAVRHLFREEAGIELPRRSAGPVSSSRSIY